MERPRETPEGQERLPDVPEPEEFRERKIGKAEASEEPENPEGVPDPDGFRERVLAKNGSDFAAPGEEQKQVSEGGTHSITPESEATTESYSRNDNQVVVTEHEFGPEPEAPHEVRVETADLHRFPGDSEERTEVQAEEPRTLEAVDYGRGAVLRAPKTDLEEEGFKPEPGENAVIQLGLKEVGSEDVETVFARYNASDRRAEAYVGDIGGEKGSRYELLEAQEVDEDRLVKEFQRGRCDHLQNVELEHDEGRMFLKVDERRVELDDYRISTSGSHAVMRGKLGGDDNCMVEFDGRRASVKYGRDYPVDGMWMEGDVLAVRYSQSRNEMHEHRMYLEHLGGPERPSLSQFDRPEMLEHVKMFDHPERVEGLYQFVLDKEARDEIKGLLERADKLGDHQYGMMKAEISERLAPNMLELIGWERVKRHPFNENTKEGASANGPDWLMRTPGDKLALVEFKWYLDRENATRKGESQVAKSFDDRMSHGGSDIEAAYIAIVDWEVDDEPVKIYVKRVRPGEKLS